MNYSLTLPDHIEPTRLAWIIVPIAAGLDNKSGHANWFAPRTRVQISISSSTPARIGTREMSRTGDINALD
jgi:hypothetical protein